MTRIEKKITSMIGVNPPVYIESSTKEVSTIETVYND